MASSLSQRTTVAKVDSALPEVAVFGRVFRSLTAKGRAHQKMLDSLEKHRVIIINKAMSELADAIESAAHAAETKAANKKGLSKLAHKTGKAIADRSFNSDSMIAVSWVGERWTLVVHNILTSLEDRNSDAEFNKDDPEGGASWDRDEKPLLSFSGRWRKRIYVNVMRSRSKYDAQRTKGIQMEGRELVGIAKHYHKKANSKGAETAASSQSEVLQKEGLPDNPLLAAAERISSIKITSAKSRYFKMIHKAISPSAWYKKQMEAITQKLHKEHSSTLTQAEMAVMSALDVFPDLGLETTALPSVLLATAGLREEACMNDGCDSADEVPWVLEIVQTSPAHELSMVASARELIVIREVCSIVQGAYRMPASAQGNSPTQRATLFLCEDALTQGELAMLGTMLKSKTGAETSISFSRLK
jgi:hypothetical protein